MKRLLEDNFAEKIDYFSDSVDDVIEIIMDECDILGNIFLGMVSKKYYHIHKKVYDKHDSSDFPYNIGSEGYDNIFTYIISDLNWKMFNDIKVMSDTIYVALINNQWNFLNCFKLEIEDKEEQIFTFIHNPSNIIFRVTNNCLVDAINRCDLTQKMDWTNPFIDIINIKNIIGVDNLKCFIKYRLKDTDKTCLEEFLEDEKRACHLLMIMFENRSLTILNYVIKTCDNDFFCKALMYVLTDKTYRIPIYHAELTPCIKKISKVNGFIQQLQPLCKFLFLKADVKILEVLGDIFGEPRIYNTVIRTFKGNLYTPINIISGNKNIGNYYFYDLLWWCNQYNRMFDIIGIAPIIYYFLSKEDDDTDYIINELLSLKDEGNMIFKGINLKSLFDKNKVSGKFLYYLCSYYRLCVNCRKNVNCNYISKIISAESLIKIYLSSNISEDKEDFEDNFKDLFFSIYNYKPDL